VLDRLRGRGDEAKWRLALAIIAGTIPAAVIGYLFEDFFETLFGQPALVAAMLLLTGVVLVFAEAWKRGGLPLANIRLSDAALIGLAQAAAIIPGLSRSGATIAAGLLRGLDRPAAARYSFLLSAPIIFGAGLFQLKNLAEGGIDAIGLAPLALGFAAAAISGFAAIRFLMRFVQTRSLYLFAVYVWLFGLLSLLRAFL
jgi:undecaprenyl-diphosphatase